MCRSIFFEITTKDLVQNKEITIVVIEMKKNNFILLRKISENINSTLRLLFNRWLTNNVPDSKTEQFWEEKKRSKDYWQSTLTAQNGLHFLFFINAQRWTKCQITQMRNNSIRTENYLHIKMNLRKSYSYNKMIQIVDDYIALLRKCYHCTQIISFSVNFAKCVLGIAFVQFWLLINSCKIHSFLLQFIVEPFQNTSLFIIEVWHRKYCVVI